MRKEVYISREFGRDGSRDVLEVDHTIRTFRTGDSMRTILRMSNAKEVSKFRLDFLKSNLKSKGYRNLGRR